MSTLPQLVLVVALSGVLGIPILSRCVRRQFDPFEPIVLFAAAYGVMFVTRPAWMIAAHHLAYDGPSSSTDVSVTFSEMLVLALLGAVAFVAAYETSPGWRLANRWRALGDLTSRRVIIAALAIGGIGVASCAAFLISFPSGVSGGLSLIFRGRTAELWRELQGTSFYLWDPFFLLVPASLVLFAVGLELRRTVLLVVALALGALFLLRTVPQGDRMTMLPLLGGGFVFYYVRRAARPSAVVLVALMLVALVSSAFLSDLRGRRDRGESVAQTIVRSMDPGRIVAPLVSGPDSEMAPAFAAALAQIPKRLHYTYGRTIFGDLVSRPIPRALWRDKPEPPRLKLVASLWPGKSRGNPEFSVLLYFFWDFGVVGVLAGMFFFGIGARALYEYFLTYRHSPAVQVLYALALWFVVIGLRNGPVDTFVQLVFVLFPAWLAVRIPARQRARGAALVST